ncbi:hypothetical protein DGG96_15225 [Legionella qingyii]|uniref:Uncharacterized protein n=1 Tax=Legionella qingyii TaxID=2184757 RepID=A0A317U276_9GAMM|nr:hypothetical protein DGG96_15225 [Legionella qingyii]
MVVLVVLFVFLQVHAGEAVPSLHIWTPVVLLQEATPPWLEQQAAYAPTSGLLNKKRTAINRFTHIEAKLAFFI